VGSSLTLKVQALPSGVEALSLVSRVEAFSLASRVQALRFAELGLRMLFLTTPLAAGAPMGYARVAHIKAAGAGP
jgi:hypothetical protein